MKRALVIGAAAALAFGAIEAAAAAPPCCTWQPRSVAATKSGTAEQRVAAWIVHRILTLSAEPGPVIDITADEVRDGTGVEPETLDAEAVGARVRERLRELTKSRFAVTAPKCAGSGGRDASKSIPYSRD